MKKWLFYFWWLSLSVSAQKTDSLLGVLGKASVDTNKVNVLFELGRAFWDLLHLAVLLPFVSAIVVRV